MIDLQHLGARVIRWAEYDGEGGEVCEAISASGALVRADSARLLIRSPPRAPARLQATPAASEAALGG